MSVWVLYVPGRPPLAAFVTRGEAIAEGQQQARFGICVRVKRLDIGWPDDTEGELPKWI